MDQIVAIIGEDPIGVAITLDTDRKFPSLAKLRANLVANRLDLLRIRTRADNKEIRERGNFPQVEHLDVCGFFGLGCAYGG